MDFSLGLAHSQGRKNNMGELEKQSLPVSAIMSGKVGISGRELLSCTKSANTTHQNILQQCEQGT